MTNGTGQRRGFRWTIARKIGGLATVLILFILGLLLCVFFWTATDALIKLAFERPPAAIMLLTFKSQFAAFAKGIVDLRNVLYFLSVTVVAVVASTYSLKSRLWR